MKILRPLKQSVGKHYSFSRKHNHLSGTLHHQIPGQDDKAMLSDSSGRPTGSGLNLTSGWMMFLRMGTVAEWSLFLAPVRWHSFVHRTYHMSFLPDPMDKSDWGTPSNTSADFCRCSLSVCIYKHDLKQKVFPAAFLVYQVNSPQVNHRYFAKYRVKLFLFVGGIW